ncbi:Lrp/AsnC family transcriptional regulator [Sulfitobacter mediterraneus]|jgi:Lrp/AsnC family transcriptional regulator, leucine-responsive regulatory protein|uniref:Lrp/AsnC family transcriptional regulator n=1 Tax=Sulfitobacter mediterraneus TaxID=83219 RepID=UPI0019316237|nr:Lrp/AsnC family transcriptional regulator [Sulfitobacter mediterraneus]MBM1632116.1 Lrp/AsnC family transcriptional regulator [Sulfitobacter mediterraneus]MBM1639931.1 Lrp/AsnC family transcriptional regulator [Sulfitobacter mediterraneus]MBM1643980.1 Lrp/AsnC family transcriptional regulator [Sulfitobacter mediterraneus]MBM1648026.1 Lrp/AsnC family transcriptional regulator [Sulfitobacter mediterraneus]MBM1652071.1 Lrp/AsnC family transcriptional regulator [Sulfitobacter mediterraneus]
MDKSDLKLLALLQDNARTTVQAMADRIGASTASVQRRLRMLREGGVIKKEVAVLDAQKLGFDVTAIVSVELERDRLDQIDAFKRKARLDAQVLNFYCIAGDADFVMVVVAKDMRDYEAFTHRFFFSDKNVRKFRTSIVVSTEKATLALPI